MVASGKISCLHPFATTCNHLQPPQPLRTKYSKSISDSDMLISDSNSGLLDGCKRLQVVASGKISCLHPFATTCNHFQPPQPLKTKYSKSIFLDQDYNKFF